MSLSATYENQAFNTLYWLHILVYILCKVQTVRVAEQKSDDALMVIRKVIRYVPYQKKPWVDSESSALKFKIGSGVTFQKHCILPDFIGPVQKVKQHRVSGCCFRRGNVCY